ALGIAEGVIDLAGPGLRRPHRVRRYELLAVPFAAVQVEQAELGELPWRQVEVVPAGEDAPRVAAPVLGRDAHRAEQVPAGELAGAHAGGLLQHCRDDVRVAAA